MNPKILSAASLLLSAGVFIIATSSIATECYNANESFSKEKKENFTFLIVTLVVAVLIILSAFGSMYLGLTSN
jgi:surface polysaccharide O-acyltransferase-like enzyme